MANLEKHSFNFKSLLDAIRIRNHVIEMFERADREPDALERRALLTFVIAGGGFAGAELAGALNDYTRGILADYPKLHPEEVSVVLVHSRDRILPELSESLARYAQKRMETRGVIFRLNTRLTDAGPGLVTLSDGKIRAETLIWTAGTAPNPLVQALPLDKDKRRALVVDRTLALPGKPELWGLGDCAAVIDAKTDKPCPPHRPVCPPRGTGPSEEYTRTHRRKAAAKISLQLFGSPVCGRASDRLRGTHSAFRAKPVDPILRTARLAHVARNLSFETTGAGAKDSGSHGLGR